jgi:hypothetical protein
MKCLCGFDENILEPEYDKNDFEVIKEKKFYKIEFKNGNVIGYSKAQLSRSSDVDIYACPDCHTLQIKKNS